MRKKIAAALLIPAALMLSACDLLPQEDEVRTVTTVRTVIESEYKTAEVVRGDLVLSKKIYCTYLPLRTDTLTFAVGGEYIEEIFVQVGDVVQKGQLLARLEMEDIDSQIAACERTIGELESQLRYLQSGEEIDRKRQQVMYANDPETLEKALDKVSASYASQRQSIEDSLYVERLQLSSLEEKREEKQIRAPYDGTITYLRTFAEGETSRLRDRVMTIVDSSMSIFRADTEEWTNMPEGKQFVIVANGTEYPVTVTTAETLGLEPEENTVGKTGRVYMKPDEMVVGLKDNDRGTLDLVLEYHEDVLMVPVSAVATMDGQTVVYYVQGNGIKGAKPVVTGLQAQSLIEIVEGVEEGEFVIVPY